MDRKKKHSPGLLAALMISALVILPGCSKDPEVTAADAKEVALDDAGYKEDEVKNLSAGQQDDGFTVEFEVNGRRLDYDISPKGLIRSRTVEKTAEEDSSKTAGQTSLSDSSSTSQNAADGIDHDAAAVALASQSLDEDNVSDLETVVDGNRVTVTFVKDNLHYSIVVDKTAGSIVSSSIQ